MLLLELFADGPLDITDDIKEDLLDILTPFKAAGLEFVTIQAIIDKLGEARRGIVIDKNLIMTILDPDKIDIIDHIDGDRIYLDQDGPPDREIGHDDAEKEKEHVDKMAKDKAKQSVAKDPPL